MKVIALIVTYNRLQVLKECIASVISQSRKPQDIIVVNNGSTDGTEEWLRNKPDIQYVTQQNSGGAGGFNRGIREAYKAGADQLWLMDDDTIPAHDALEKLLQAHEALMKEPDEFGFLASKVLWTSGEPHLMNRVEDPRHFNGIKAPEYYQSIGVFPIKAATFVSVLISRKAVRMAGLPLKEFFIWHDDIEYTIRITSYNLKGGQVPDSIAIHKTPTNYREDIFLDEVKNAWKYHYGLRNQLYFRRHDKSYGSYLRNVIKRIFVMPVKILVRRKDGRWPYIKAVWSSCWSALWFNPRIEHVED